MHLVVVIPALNEEATVEGVVRRVPRKLEGVDHVDVLVIDDGSSDATADLSGSVAGQRGIGQPGPGSQ